MIPQKKSYYDVIICIELPIYAFPDGNGLVLDQISNIIDFQLVILWLVDVIG